MNTQIDNNTQIIEGNKLIAEFMGYKINWGYKKPNNLVLYINTVVSSDKLKYNSSWDWLMLVVEKIGSMANNKQNDFDNRVKYQTYQQFVHCSIFSPIEAVYIDCLDFIKWYNEQKES